MDDPTQVFHDALPPWAQVLLPVALPLSNVAIGSVLLALTHLFLRPRAENEHWTERSRWHFAGHQLALSAVLASSALTVVFSVIVWEDLLDDRRRVAQLLPTQPWLLAVMLCPILSGIGHVLRWLRSRWFWPELRFRDHLLSSLGRGWISFLILVAVIPVAAFGPRDGWALLVVPPATVLYLVWIFRGGSITLGRLCRWIQPAPPRLRRIVDVAAEQSGHRVAGIWVDASRYFNAYAMPAAQQIVVTRAAAEQLNDDELYALVLHEVGHLRDHRSGARHRLAALTFLSVLALWQPLLHHLGGGWLALILGATLLLTHLGAQGTRQRESTADAHATDALEASPGLYARTLERLHQGNFMPAVIRATKTAHPALYDRMLLAGVTPDYPRPAPPPSPFRPLLIAALLTIPLYCAELFTVQWLRRSVYRSPDHAVWAVVATGGSPAPIGALGYHWRTARPEAAEAAWTLAARHSALPEFPALLAQRLAARDPSAARSWLQKAEAALARLPGPQAWRQEQVAAARRALDR